MSPRIAVVETPGDAEREAILAILAAHNDAAVGPTDRRPVAITVRDDDGTIAGGLWGTAAYRWLFIQYLALAPQLQGQGIGRELIRSAEDEARRLNCIGIWLDTFSFQARGLYEKLGFRGFGEIAEYPPGEARFFLAKRID